MFSRIVWWEFPTPGFAKLNLDAFASSFDNVSGGRGIFKDEVGSLLFYFSDFFRKSDSKLKLMHCSLDCSFVNNLG